MDWTGNTNPSAFMASTASDPDRWKAQVGNVWSTWSTKAVYLFTNLPRQLYASTRMGLPGAPINRFVIAPMGFAKKATKSKILDGGGGGVVTAVDEPPNRASPTFWTVDVSASNIPVTRFEAVPNRLKGSKMFCGKEKWGSMSKI